MILDTEFCISLRAEESAALELAAELEASGIPTRIPTVVIEELYVGVGAGDDANDNARAYEALVANKPVVELDENVSRRAGVLEGEHLASDSKPTLGPNDAVVAATGLVYNDPVVTSDTDFESVDGLSVELY
ncbi:PIN domain-containing protein [Halomicroarcula sp. F28]|uniref:PIN domain-containing protein n=1 Tax=Haloarcula salinisoli TaxID=2487746 RepID=UPI001C7389C5|nr:PIN domain-containing protein [Halomicroarcula salinisoli]MBX0287200.1 PIN domain-containing protein [Halomicroarcula salinisoli]